MEHGIYDWTGVTVTRGLKNWGAGTMSRAGSPVAGRDLTLGELGGLGFVVCSDV